jgi:hypothetical protein
MIAAIYARKSTEQNGAADERNDHAAIDLICATCDFVIATLHDRAKQKGA